MNSLRPRTLTDYFRAARRRKFVILATAIVFAAAAFIAIKRLPNVYESHFFVTVVSPISETAIDPARKLAALEQRLANPAQLESIIKKHDLFKEATERGTEANDLIAKMRAQIRVSDYAGRANQFRISYLASDPALAREVANDLAAALASHSAKVEKSTSIEADKLRERASELSAAVRELEEKAPWLVALKEAAPASAAPVRSAQPSSDAIRAQQMTIESLKDRQYLIQQQIADIERRIASERQLVEQQKKNSTLRDNPTYALLIAKRAELQGQRDTLINRQELTEKHPRVTAITDQITAINRQIEELRQQDAGQAIQSPEARELMSLESERNRLKLELEINNREMARRSARAPVQSQAPATVSKPSPTSTRLAERYFALKQDYEDARARVENAESNQTSASSAKSEQVRLLDEANLPEQPLSLNSWLLALAALAAGLALGACFAVALESRRFQFVQDAKDVDFYTRLPLLAQIPKTVSVDERNRAARQSQLRFAIGAIIAVVATFALAQIFIITNIFTLIGKR